jgi:DNA-directed RNA polymerase specialized sigma24 family protein
MAGDDAVARQERLSRLLKQFEAPLMRYAVRLTGRVEAARDVVQDVFQRYLERQATTGLSTSNVGLLTHTAIKAIRARLSHETSC